LPKAIDGSAAFDSGTREKSEAEAAVTLAGMAYHLASADIAYKKIDNDQTLHSKFGSIGGRLQPSQPVPPWQGKIFPRMHCLYSAKSCRRSPMRDRSACSNAVK